jgi:hypothetical protein
MDNIEHDHIYKITDNAEARIVIKDRQEADVMDIREDIITALIDLTVNSPGGELEFVAVADAQCAALNKLATLLRYGSNGEFKITSGVLDAVPWVERGDPGSSTWTWAGRTRTKINVDRAQRILDSIPREKDAQQAGLELTASDNEDEIQILASIMPGSCDPPAVDEDAIRARVWSEIEAKYPLLDEANKDSKFLDATHVALSDAHADWFEEQENNTMDRTEQPLNMVEYLIPGGSWCDCDSDEIAQGIIGDYRV